MSRAIDSSLELGVDGAAGADEGGGGGGAGRAVRRRPLTPRLPGEPTGLALARDVAA